MVVVVAAALARFLSSIDPRRPALELGRRLAAVSGRRFAALTAAAALGLGIVLAWTVHRASPTSVDEAVQLLHARALLEGGLALPLAGPPAAWATVNAVITDAGWASIYPPGHTLWLALWLAAGLSWAAGPVAVAVAVAALARAVDLLTSGNPAGRVGVLLVALSPYVQLIGSTHLSHASAAMALSLVLYFALRAARSGHPGWAVATGAAVGAAVCVRPWTGLTLSAAILAGVVWIGRPRGAARLAAGLVLGGLPFAGGLLAWNAALFGSPWTLGYSAAFGPAHGLGFHTDPWGNLYGVREALAYTGVDLLQLGAHLLQSPLPATLLVAGALVFTGLPRGAGVFLAWAAAASVANAFYWHHGVHMGPRLLFEAGPPWAVLTGMAAWKLLVGADGEAAPRGAVARAGGWAAVLTLAGAAALAPGIVSAYRAAPPPTGVLTAAEPSADPVLVFVHGSWSSRVAARLAASGMRRDSLETALRRNDLCRVDAYARTRAAADGGGEGGGSGSGAPSPQPRLSERALDLRALPGSPPGLEVRLLSPGNPVRVDPGYAWDERCLREARADRLGTQELEPLAWRTRPVSGKVVLLRDLGPAENGASLAAYPGRAPWVWVAFAGEAGRLLPYREGMELLWGGPAPRR